jgi:elongation factor Ts
MSDIKKISELRERTFAGFSECQKALKEANGDVEAAISLLREKGIASLSKRAMNETNEGCFGMNEDNTKVCLIELMCETDFVASNDSFKKCANDIAEAISKDDSIVKDSQTLLEKANQINASIMDTIMSLKENIKVGRTAIFSTKDGAVYHYIHYAGKNRIAAMVKLSEESEKGKSIAVHIACSNPYPLALREEDITDDMLKTAPAYSNVKELVLTQQPFFRDTSTTIQKYLGDIKVLDFVRMKIGE